MFNLNLLNNYYCKNCKKLIMSFCEAKEKFLVYDCLGKRSENNKFISFLNCQNCDKFVGIYHYKVCKTCFGKYLMFDKEKIKKWFLEYKQNEFCKHKKFRHQHYFFEELTIYKFKIIEN